jgi:hypothetical protein
MKTIKSITVLLSMMAILFSMNLNATEEHFNFNEEAYINDIPFSTECVTAEYLYEKAMAEDYNFEEEAYIEDIPFNTECVTASCRYQKAISIIFEFEEEPYINDIPFNTYALAGRQKCASLASRN